MKIKLECEEWWPYYFISDNKDYSIEFDFPEKKVKEIKRILKEFEASQEELYQIFRKSGNSPYACDDLKKESTLINVKQVDGEFVVEYNEV